MSLLRINLTRILAIAIAQAEPYTDLKTLELTVYRINDEDTQEEKKSRTYAISSLQTVDNKKICTINVNELFDNDEKDGFRFITIKFIDSVGLSSSLEEKKRDDWHYRYAGAKIIFEAQGQGTILAKLSTGEELNSGTKVSENKSVRFEARPETGYEVDKWSTNVVVDGTDKNKASLLVTNSPNPINVSVSFKKIAVVVNTWKKLYEAVVSASDGAELVIDGELIPKAGDSEIAINKNITIKGKNKNRDQDILNANNKIRIFTVAANKTLSLKDITLKNAKISPTENGAAVLCKSAELKAENCIFADNTTALNTASSGGAIYVGENGGNCELKNCEFTMNEANTGGAVYIGKDAKATITACKFKANSAIIGAALYVLGDCRIESSASDTTVFGGAEDDGNVAGEVNQIGIGAGLYAGKGAKCEISENVEFSYNSIRGSSDSSGGSIAFIECNTVTIRGTENAPVKITESTVKNDRGTAVIGKGGGIYISNCNPTIDWLIISSCSAAKGGGIYAENTTATISNLTASRCSRGNGGGIYYVPGPSETFMMKGLIKMDEDSDIYLSENNAVKSYISIIGDLDSGSSAYIFPSGYDEGLQLLKTSGIPYNAENYRKFKIKKPVPTSTWYIDDNGKLKQ